MNSTRESLSAANLPIAPDLTTGTVDTIEEFPTSFSPPDEQPENQRVGDAPDRQLGFAVVGLGKLAREEVMPAFRECQIARPMALVSGDADKAGGVAREYGICEGSIYRYEDFDRMADDPSIDVVYILLPNSMHAEFTIRALKAGKHVLCEKPMAVTVEEGQAMARAAREAGKKLAIAYRLHYEPLNRQVMAWCREKRFGEIRSFTSSNCQKVQAPNIRLSAKLGGGPVADAGIYCINAARYAIGEEPVEVHAVAHFPSNDNRFEEVPESVAFLLRYPSGVIASCDTSFGTAEGRRYRIQCEQGYIEMDPAFSYRGLRLTTQQELGEDESSAVAEIRMRQQNHFAAEMDGFARAILEDREVITPASMGIADLRIIAAIQESYETGKRVTIS